MENNIFYALIGVNILLFIACIIILLIGRRKLTVTKGEVESLQQEKKRIAPLEHELLFHKDQYNQLKQEVSMLTTTLATEVEKSKHHKNKVKQLKTKLSTLTSELAAEVTKNKHLKELSQELQTKRKLIEEFQEKHNQNQKTIKQLDNQIKQTQSQLRETYKKEQETSNIVEQIKQVFA